ncbi:hypothetical protein Q1695_006112 [Nippostrongylus brasiliensis]|nr:hypothetical protein Q1695_006112 [Nippostrongylus brasiliensis]
MSERKTIYDFSVKDINGDPVSLSKYKGLVVMVVNVASQCGFTKTNYTEFKVLLDTYHSKAVRGVKGNSLWKVKTVQPLGLRKILQIIFRVKALGCRLLSYEDVVQLRFIASTGLLFKTFAEPACEIEIVKNVKEKYGCEPDIYGKINVNGEDADPFWVFLKKEQGGFLTDAIKWNFTKFLVNRRGEVVKRFAPSTSPKSIIPDIENDKSSSDLTSTELVSFTNNGPHIWTRCSICGRHRQLIIGRDHGRKSVIGVDEKHGRISVSAKMGYWNQNTNTSPPHIPRSVSRESTRTSCASERPPSEELRMNDTDKSDKDQKTNTVTTNTNTTHAVPEERLDGGLKRASFVIYRDARGSGTMTASDVRRTFLKILSLYPEFEPKKIVADEAPCFYDGLKAVFSEAKTRLTTVALIYY